MQFCSAHWEGLVERVRAAGLYHYVAKGGDSANAKMMAGEFEPLLGAHNAILGNMLNVFGFNALDDGCPICKAEAFVPEHMAECTRPECLVKPGVYEGWLDHAVADQLEEAKRLGLPTIAPT